MTVAEDGAVRAIPLLGLGVGTFRGLPVFTHSGGTFGFTTLMFMLC